MLLKARKTLSFKEERDINEKIKYLEDVRDEVEVQQGVKHEVKDSTVVEEKLKQLKRVKEQYGVTRLEGKERDGAEKEVSRITDRIRQKWGGTFPTYEEYWMNSRKGGIQYMRLVDKIQKLNSDREYAALVQRWKNLQRCLEPNDPHASNTMKFFPQ